MGFDNIGKPIPSILNVAVSSGAGPLSGIDWNYLDTQQTSSTVDTYLFYDNSTDLNLLKTCVVTYVDDTKADLDTVEWSWHGIRF